MLPELEVLKLKDYSFQGSEWESTDERFQQLKFLLLDGTDLIHWIVNSIQFPKLESLVLKNCYCLSEIPDDVAEIPTLQFIELYHVALLLMSLQIGFKKNNIAWEMKILWCESTNFITLKLKVCVHFTSTSIYRG